jgi:hypothetical protein
MWPDGARVGRRLVSVSGRGRARAGPKRAVRVVGDGIRRGGWWRIRERGEDRAVRSVAVM